MSHGFSRSAKKPDRRRSEGLLFGHQRHGPPAGGRPCKAGVGCFARGRLVKHARYYWLLLAEGHLNRRLLADMRRRIWAFPLPRG